MMKNLLYLLCLLLSVTGTAYAKEQPDFRYPQTVVQQASEDIRKATKSGNGQLLVDGLVKLSLAKSKISEDYMPELIHTVDSAAAAADDPCIRAILRSFEGDMYLAFMHRTRPYDRNEIEGPLPTDISEWSTADMTDKILQLAEAALADKEQLAQKPIGTFKRIFNIPEYGTEFAPTLYDALAYHALEQIESAGMPNRPMPLKILTSPANFMAYPFLSDNDAVNLTNAIYASLLKTHQNDTPAFIYAELHRLSHSTRRMATSDAFRRKYEECLFGLYDQFAESKYATEILADLAENVYTASNEKKLYELAQAQIREYPSYPRINALKNYVNQYEHQYLSVNYPDCIVREDSLSLTFDIRNQKKATVKAYRIPFGTRPDTDWENQLNRFQIARTATYTFTGNEQNAREAIRNFPPLEFGQYIITAEFTDRKTGKIAKSHTNWNSILTVSNLAVAYQRINDENRIYAIQVTDGKPVAGALLHLSDTKTVKTNRNGYAVVDNKTAKNSFTVYATDGQDRSPNTYILGSSSGSNDQIRCEILTDLAVYRPGDTVRFSAVAYETSKNGMAACRNKTLRAILFNPNNQQSDSLEMRCDDFGRIDSLFRLPKNGLTGNFSIAVINPTDRSTLNRHAFQVSEYKAPTFYISYNEKQSSLSDADSLCLRGNICTYSQFPLAETELDYRLTPYSFWGWNYYNNPTDGTAKTDSQGNWSIPLSDDLFNGEQKYGCFQLWISATSTGGETQTLSRIISIGNKKHIDILTFAPIRIDGTETPIPFKVSNIDGTTCNAACRYELKHKAAIMAQGTVSSDNPAADFSNVPSGKYDLRLYLLNDTANQATAPLILYRESDSIPPIDTRLWTTETAIRCDENGAFSFRLGSSHASYLYYVVYNDEEVTDEGCILREKGIHDFQGKAKFTQDGNTRISLIAVRNHTFEEKLIDLLPLVPRDSVKLVTETFRDNIIPGSQETWKLRLKGNNGKTYTAAVIANMYDAALNSFADNTYSFYAYRPWQETYKNSLPYHSYHSIYAASALRHLPVAALDIPCLDFYGQQFFSSSRYFGIRVHGTAKPMYKTAPNDAIISHDEAAVPESDMALHENIVTDQNARAAQETPFQYRDEGIKNAFFLPALVTDENGEVIIQFNVPNRNTQWQFSAIAYTTDMKHDFINRLVSASKPLMVQPNMPRFVRIGDTAEIKATVMNNTGSPTEADATVEFFTPENGQILQTDTFRIEIPAHGSATLASRYTATANHQFIGYRIKASNGQAADGEQNIIAVLPATTEVTEADPFYLSHGQQHGDFQLPEFKSNGKITFEYSDNPVWYSLAALPGIVSESETATALIANYYATVMADKIVRSDARIADAFRKWGETQSLESNLLRNEELKTLALENTPWVSDAATETAAMARIAELTDAATIQYREQKSLTSLKELQNHDGGFSWLKGSESSAYITWEILNYFGKLKESGSFKNDELAKGLIRRAIGFCDSLLAESFKRLDNPEAYASAGSRYLYIRSMHKDIPLNDALVSIQDKVIKSVAEKWGNFSIPGKAEAAVLLANCGKAKEASAIVESLRQFARKQKGQGMYWDITTGDKLETAVTALNAICKVNPKDKDIDSIRQWILLQKETRSWKNASTACDAIHALALTGSDWTDTDSNAPDISIGGMRIDTENAIPYFGYIKRTIDAEGIGTKKLSVDRSGKNPAWGAIYCQYSAPMNEVEQNSAEGISVEKKFYRYDRQNRLEPADTGKITVGDRLQVHITIKTTRDLDFVALTDDRAAGLEPADQLPIYSWMDGVRTYRETKDSATNIFFTHLKKGTYVITYDAFANNAGSYNSGLTTVQCQYAPQIVAHSAGTVLTITEPRPLP